MAIILRQCRAKVRYATKEEAERSAEHQRVALRPDPQRVAQIRAYYCPLHGAWHTGNGPRQVYQIANDPTVEAIGRLHTLKHAAIQNYGASRDPREWEGVRILTRVIQHLQRTL